MPHETRTFRGRPHQLLGRHGRKMVPNIQVPTSSPRPETVTREDVAEGSLAAALLGEEDE